jgi:hypothetical protein
VLHYPIRSARGPSRMGGQDLLPPAKAGGARRSNRSTLKVTALISTIIIVILLYASQHAHPPTTPPASATTDAIAVPARHPETVASVYSSQRLQRMHWLRWPHRPSSA